MVNKVNLARWRKHLKRAAVRGITLAQYARENGLSRHTLYAASQQQRVQALAERIDVKAGLQRNGRTGRSAFIAVRLPEAQSALESASESIGSKGAAMLQAKLPNGVQIGIEVRSIEAGAAQSSQGSSAQAPWMEVLRVLAGLSCSR